MKYAALNLVALAIASLASGCASQSTDQSILTPGRIIVLGDSLSVSPTPGEAFPALLQARLTTRGSAWIVENAGIRGDTTRGGVNRIDALLARRPAVLILALGANDGLRGLPLAQTRANLDRMIVASKAAGARVLLVGMRIPPNYGRDYTQGFEANYAALAKSRDVPLVPFLLAPIAADRANFQDDNLHPVAAAQPKIRDHVWKALDPLLR